MSPCSLHCRCPKNGDCRLHVGWRRIDWSPVWTIHKPKPPADDEDDSRRKKKEDDEHYYFEVVTKEKQWAPIREGEIAWEPVFNPEYHEAGTMKTKQELQRETINQALRYLSEKDPMALKALEIDMEKRNAPRWSVWFKRAKQFKTAQMKRLAKFVRRQESRGIPARQAREQFDWDADQGYVSGEDSDDGDDDDDNDDSDDGQGGAPPANMGPPPRPGRAGIRRPASSPPPNGARRPRLDDDLDGNQRFTARGARHSSVISTRSSILNGFQNDGDDGSDAPYDDESLDYDPRPPEEHSPTPFTGRSAASLLRRTPTQAQNGQQQDPLRTTPAARRGHAPRSASQLSRTARTPVREQSPAQVREHNDGLPEDQAMLQAMAASEEEQRRRDAEDETLQRGIRASMDRDNGAAEGVRQSIEQDEEMNGL